MVVSARNTASIFSMIAFPTVKNDLKQNNKLIGDYLNFTFKKKHQQCFNMSHRKTRELFFESKMNNEQEKKEIHKYQEYSNDKCHQLNNTSSIIMIMKPPRKKEIH